MKSIPLKFPYRSIELTADGQYVAIKAAAYPYGVKAAARKATKVAGLFNRRPVFSRNIENTMLIAGRFEQVIEMNTVWKGLVHWLWKDGTETVISQLLK